MPSTLTTLRASLLAAGWTATSPRILDDEAEQMARDERKDLPMTALSLQDDMATQLHQIQGRLSWPQAEACAADLIMMLGRRMRDCPLTCEYCDCAPATHLLVADLVKPAGGRATDLVCVKCGEAGVGDAAQISVSRSSVWLFALIPAGKDAR